MFPVQSGLPDRLHAMADTGTNLVKANFASL